jgi:hypothetical protein
MSDTYKKQLIENNELANKIVLLLNGNSIQRNLSVLKFVKYALKKHSIIEASKEELEKEHARFKYGTLN